MDYLYICVRVSNPSCKSYSYFNLVVSASSVSVVEHDEIVSSQDSSATSMVRPNATTRTNRYAILHCSPPQFPKFLFFMSHSICIIQCFSHRLRVLNLKNSTIGRKWVAVLNLYSTLLQTDCKPFACYILPWIFYQLDYTMLIFSVLFELSQ